MMTTALKIKVNYSKIIFVLHIKISYKMIDYIQKSECTKQEKKTINLIILIKNNKIQ